MIEKKVILTDGDSWTAGDIIDPSKKDSINGFVNHPDNDNYRLPRVWPGKLESLLQTKVINQAVAGSSNDGILRRVINSVVNLLKDYNNDEILVIIGFSSPERKDFFYKKDKIGSWDTLYPFNIDDEHLTEDRKQFNKIYANTYWNEEEFLSRYINTVISLHSFLKSKGIDHIFFNAFYEEPGEIASTNFFNKLSKLKHRLSDNYLKHINIDNSLQEYINIHKKIFLKSSFSEYIKDSDTFKGYHPSEESHFKWAKFIKTFIVNRNLYCIKDKVNSAVLHNPSAESLELYKDVPEINDIDNRGFPICRPLFSTSDMHNYLNIKEKNISELKDGENFLYITMLHHDNVLAFKHIDLLPNNILTAARQEKCKIIFDNSLEGHNVENIYPQIYESIKKLNLPSKQIFYITNNLYAEDHHDKFLTKNNIKNSINVISFMYNVNDVKRLIFANNIIEGGRLPEHVDINKLIEYKTKHLSDIKPFLKVNRTGRPERNLFMLYINKHNLLDKFKISFPEYCNEEYGYDFFPEITTKENINSLKDKIPFDIDQTDTDNHGEPGIGKGKFDADLPFQVKHYDNTFISVVMCAFPFEEACHLHSSTFNPIYCGHPVIQFGPKGHLAELKRRGFKTFDKWWDESYDSITDHWSRFSKILEIVHNLSKKTNKELLEMYIDMKDTLQYNSDLIYNYNIHNNLTNKILLDE